MSYTLEDLRSINVERLSLIDRAKFCSVVVAQLSELYVKSPHLMKMIREVYFSAEILKKILQGELNEKAVIDSKD